MSGRFDFDSAASCTEDALNLIDAVDELLAPLTQCGREALDPSAVYELTRRAHMIDATLRAARDKAQDAAALFRKADESAA